MINQRQIDFRREYRSRIIGWYDGYFHIAIIYAMGAAAFYIYIEHIHDVIALEWLTGWLDAACEQEPGLALAADLYLRRRLREAAAGALAVTVGHADLLVLP